MHDITQAFAPLATLLLLALTPLVARAETPTPPDAVLRPGCDAARATETCPACSCVANGQTQSADGARIGVIVDVRGKRADGGEVAASHVLIGAKDALAHLGRLGANGTKDGKVTTYEVGPLPPLVQRCVGKCGFEPVGPILPFSVTTTRRSPQQGEHGPETLVQISKEVALCFELAGAVKCGTIGVGDEELIELPPKAGQTRPRVRRVHEAHRSWKLGARGELVLGAYRGNVHLLYPHFNGRTLPLATIFDAREARTLAR